MVLKEFDIGGNSAIVTGAARGLGKAIALTLAEAGADVAVADFREEVEETAREIRELGRKGIAVRTDVREAEQVEHMVQAALAEFGKVDIMVANAGVEWVKPLLLVDGKPPVRMRVDVDVNLDVNQASTKKTGTGPSTKHMKRPFTGSVHSFPCNAIRKVGVVRGSSDCSSPSSHQRPRAILPGMSSLQMAAYRCDRTSERPGAFSLRA